MAPAVYSRKRQRALERELVDASGDFRGTANAASASSSPDGHSSTEGLVGASREDLACAKPSKDTAAARSRKRRWVQLHLDAGQRDLSHRACAECGMVYAPGAPGDNALHRSVHARFLANRDRPPQLAGPDPGIGYPIASMPQARVLAVRPQDTGRARRWVQRVDTYVASQMGDVSLTAGYFETPSWLALLYVSSGQPAVDGYLLLERVTTRRQASISSEGISTVEAPSLEVVGSFCGVRRIWVAPGCRRRGIASMLLEQARRCFRADGQVMSRECLVFTIPTRAGALLALDYTQGCGQGSLGVYEPSSSHGSRESDT